MRRLLQSLFARPSARQMRVLPQNETVLIAPGQTLLEAALAHGIAYPHDCTVGACAACKTRLIQGRVREAAPFAYALSKAELEAGYILACQAFPCDELTVVEIDPEEV